MQCPACNSRGTVFGSYSNVTDVCFRRMSYNILHPVTVLIHTVQHGLACKALQLRVPDTKQYRSTGLARLCGGVSL